MRRTQASLIYISLAVILTSCQVINSYELTQPKESTEPKETLIIVQKATDIPNFRSTHSRFVKQVDSLGHKLTLKSADDPALKLSQYGEFLYDNIIFFCNQVDVFKGSLEIKDILDFIDSGRNLLLSTSNSPGTLGLKLAREVGYELKDGAAKREYANTKLNDLYYVIGDKSKYPSTSFSYSGMQLKMLKSELSLEILSNNAPVDDIRPTASGKFETNILIGATQARNNARVLVSGSMDFFSDKAFDASNKANQHLSNELLKWVLKEKSLLRFSDVIHKKVDSNVEPPRTALEQINFEGYTVMDEIEYSIKIEIYSDGKWVSYTADDVQLEFVRIDPFVRLTLQRQQNGIYYIKFKVPDVYGVYKFQVNYVKEGLTYLFSSSQVSVRPLKHNEYERFIISASPYYLSAFLMLVYLYVFSFVYLYQQREKRNNK